MTTPTEAPGAPEFPLVHSSEPTPTTVAASSHASHASALVVLDTPSKYTQLIREHAEMMRAGKSSHEIIRHL
jgi:hypothetical protein